jgi:hypothetical protein
MRRVKPMLVFVHIPKTAGCSFNFILENSFGISACQTNHTKKKVFDQQDLHFARRFFPRLRCITGHNLMDVPRLGITNPFYLTFVREPVARLLSHYQDSVLKGGNTQSFEDSVRSRGIFENLQVKMLAGEPNLDKAKQFLEQCHFVGLTEQFDFSLQLLKCLCPHKLNLHYVRRRVAQSNDIKKSIQNDPRLMELAIENNNLDLQLYDFATKEIFPKRCAEARLSPNSKVPVFERYRSEARPKFLAFSFYNMLCYRQLYKLLFRKQQTLDRSVVNF